MRRSGPTRCAGSAHPAGYTMVEVVVVVAVIAIIAGVAVPMLGSTASTRLASAARMLAADLDHARIATVTRTDHPTLLVFNGDGTGYHLAHADTPDEPIEHPTDRTPYVIEFGRHRAATLAGVTITALDFDDASRLAFGRWGELPQADPARVTLAADGRTLTVTVHPTSGEVQIGQVE